MAKTIKVVKKSTGTKSTAKESGETQVVTKPATHEEIAQLAYQFWAEGGYQDGHAQEDWYRAEHELRSA